MAKQLIEKHNIRHVDPIVAIQIGSLIVKVFRGIAHVTEGLLLSRPTDITTTSKDQGSVL